MSRMFSGEVKTEYFEWMFKMVCEGRYADTISYRKLLEYLHDTEFRYVLRGDIDRANDGINLRHRFALRTKGNYDYTMDCLAGPCSVFEMMIALAIRCEETIMDDPRVGDRTGQWFWKMITNLGLGSMSDDRFDFNYVKSVISDFLYRDYEPDGRGGLFIIKNCEHDLRRMEIWNQLCYFLDTMI